ncbi:hypothetical protein PACTADRAFT_48674 [Pachysolen tannophilus NRRL Y-2460]|uniref:Uncharacterized protein n=1 Tax=Pachysolen tannophilus NRRL Y-2460 TaxID=669874 RepID=A0A1E4TYM3_PACTA|nr:hypothetical protein PACTADRAFT_48674 [Pachysolen tannophilus NRRL Y-2460]
MTNKINDLSNEIVSLAEKIFPSRLVIEDIEDNDNDERFLQLSVKHINNLDSEIISSCLNLLELNLSHYYIKYNGENWKDGKLLEMHEDGLIYVYYTDYKNKCNVPIFLSFMNTIDNGLKVFYLYEIQIAENYRNRKNGRLLLSKFHDLCSEFNQKSNEKLYGTALTVFSENEAAYRFYLHNGYSITNYSPKDKKLRHGKILKPEYYILSRPLKP